MMAAEVLAAESLTIKVSGYVLEIYFNVIYCYPDEIILWNMNLNLHILSSFENSGNLLEMLE